MFHGYIMFSETTVRTIQTIALIALVGGSIGLVGSGVFVYGYNSDYTKELLDDLKLIVIAGVLASFALIGLGRRASVDKPN